MTRCSFSGLLGLPPELASVLVIGGFLRPTEAITVRRVCRALRQLVESETAAPYWRSLSTARWPIYRAAIADAGPGTPAGACGACFHAYTSDGGGSTNGGGGGGCSSGSCTTNGGDDRAGAEDALCSIRWWRVFALQDGQCGTKRWNVRMHGLDTPLTPCAKMDCVGDGSRSFMLLVDGDGLSVRSCSCAATGDLQNGQAAPLSREYFSDNCVGSCSWCLLEPEPGTWGACELGSEMCKLVHFASPDRRRLALLERTRNQHTLESTWSQITVALDQHENASMTQGSYFRPRLERGWERDEVLIFAAGNGVSHCGAVVGRCDLAAGGRVQYAHFADIPGHLCRSCTLSRNVVAMEATASGNSNGVGQFALCDLRAPGKALLTSVRHRGIARLAGRGDHSLLASYRKAAVEEWDVRNLREPARRYPCGRDADMWAAAHEVVVLDRRKLRVWSPDLDSKPLTDLRCIPVFMEGGAASLELERGVVGGPRWLAAIVSNQHVMMCTRAVGNK